MISRRELLGLASGAMTASGVAADVDLLDANPDAVAIVIRSPNKISQDVRLRIHDQLDRTFKGTAFE